MTFKDNNGWNEYGGYMSAKLQKMDEQFKRDDKKQISNIFKGISVFINGYTNPPDYKLRELLQQHGGRYCHHYNKESVTHIIAHTLPQSKIDRLTYEKIITAGWIVDSVKAGRLLEWSDYQLYSARYNSNINIMNNFIQNDNNTNCKETVDIDTGAISLSEYYSKSRLHHLSTWANELNIYLQSLKSEHNEEFINFPGRIEFIDYYNNIIDDNKTAIVDNESILMHIDMDCFFVSVGIRNRPDLIGQPVVVTHSSKGETSMAAVASSSYEARKFGIKNGMLLGKAKTLCPNLSTINYQFDEYLEVSKTLYRTMARFTHDIEVGSCDELYINLLDILKLPIDSNNSNETKIIDPRLFANFVRSIIKKDTLCPSSCGIGANLLQCKLATKKAKPDGVFWLKNNEIEEYLGGVSVREMPGIGRVLEEKLNSISVSTFGDLQKLSIEKLQTVFGIKTAKKLFDNCRGKDDRVLQIDKQRKSISAEINYGIRLSSLEECENFFRKLSEEISKRLKQANMKGSFLTLKIMIRQAEASLESAKYLGHGFCDNYSKSVKLLKATNDGTVIFNYSTDLFKDLKKDVRELRGVGLVMQKLQSENISEEHFINSGYNKIDNFFAVKTNIESLLPDSPDNEDDCKITDVIYNGNYPLLKAAETITSKNNKIKHPDLSKSKSIDVNKTRQRPGSSNVPTNQLTINEMFTKKNENLKRIVVEDEKTKVYLAKLGQTSIDKLKTAIKEWVECEQEPLKEDFVLIRNQIVDMMSDSVRNVKELLKTLSDSVDHKYGHSESGQLWRQCCENITQSVQDVSFDLFGEYLELN